MGVQFPGKKRYVTLEWPLMLMRWVISINSFSFEIRQRTRECVSRLFNSCKMSDVYQNNKLYLL